MTRTALTATAFCILLSVGALGCGPDETTSMDTNGNVMLEYVAHACFRLTSPAGHTVLIDPFESRWWLGYDFPADLPATDAVLITHPHSDHDGGMAAQRDVPWESSARVLTDPGEYRLGDIRIRGIAGKHAEPYGKEFGQTNTIWVLEVAGLRIVHVGDNGPLTDALATQISGADILMLPIDSNYHILKREEIQVFRTRLAPAILIPMHYRHPDLEIEPHSPDDLGSLDTWLETERSVRRFMSHAVTLSRDALPSEPQVLVLEHSPRVTPPPRP